MTSHPMDNQQTATIIDGDSGWATVSPAKIAWLERRGAVEFLRFPDGDEGSEGPIYVLSPGFPWALVVEDPDSLPTVFDNDPAF